MHGPGQATTAVVTAAHRTWWFARRTPCEATARVVMTALTKAIANWDEKESYPA